MYWGEGARVREAEKGTTTKVLSNAILIKDKKNSFMSTISKNLTKIHVMEDKRTNNIACITKRFLMSDRTLNLPMVGFQS